MDEGAAGQKKLVRVDPTLPVLTVGPRTAEDKLPHAYSDELQTLSAATASGTLGAIERYEWDVDGDGAFEIDSGLQYEIQTLVPLGQRGHPVSARVTGETGRTSISTVASDVRLRPPPGPVGVSINDGDLYTNDPNVEVSMVWPAYALDALVSNDGGLGGAGSYEVTPTISWTLDSAGSDRLPRTVYVRFSGGDAGLETFQDDIILDTTAPVIESVRIGGGAAASSAGFASKSAGKRSRVRVKADDNVSGVTEIQVFARGGGEPSEWLPFSETIRAKGRRVSVRVKDGAGNVSRWAHAKKKKKRKRPRRR
jgi:hypothetical protein